MNMSLVHINLQGEVGNVQNTSGCGHALLPRKKGRVSQDEHKPRYPYGNGGLNGMQVVNPFRGVGDMGKVDTGGFVTRYTCHKKMGESL